MRFACGVQGSSTQAPAPPLSVFLFDGDPSPSPKGDLERAAGPSVQHFVLIITKYPHSIAVVQLRDCSFNFEQALLPVLEGSEGVLDKSMLDRAGVFVRRLF